VAKLITFKDISISFGNALILKTAQMRMRIRRDGFKKCVQNIFINDLPEHKKYTASWNTFESKLLLFCWLDGFGRYWGVEWVKQFFTNLNLLSKIWKPKNWHNSFFKIRIAQNNSFGK
jgi:hypothetical protein